jgi:hypothetical protein
MNHHETVSILRAQIGESEKAKGKISEALNAMTKKAELAENKWKGKPCTYLHCFVLLT